MNVLLFSGGIDSTALAFWKRPDCLMFVDYGQVSSDGELRAARKIASELRIPLESYSPLCRSLGLGQMAGKEPLSDVAPEFWPYRNQLLITFAAMVFFTQPELTISIGTVSTDHIHPDGNALFLAMMNQLLRCQGNASVVAPAIDLTSDELIQKAGLPLDLAAWTFSCHCTPEACGQCRGCFKHAQTLTTAFHGK